MVRYSSKWDNATKADTSKLQEIADIAAKEVEKKRKLPVQQIGYF